MKTNFFFALFSILFLSLSSCKNEEKMLYFQGNFPPKDSLQLHTTFDPIVKKNDLLEIKLIASNEEAVKLLAPDIPNARTSLTYNSGGVAKGGFLVSQDGDIELPFIGKFHAADKKRSEIEKEIKISLSEYIKDPIVQIQIINFKVTVLGDVKQPGTINIPNEKMTILELLGIVGDMSITGRRRDVKLIREENGQLKEYKVDLTKKDLFAQKYYFLQQNDIIYVPQNRAKINNANFSQIYLPILSSVSVMLSAISIIGKF